MLMCLLEYKWSRDKQLQVTVYLRDTENWLSLICKYSLWFKLEPRWPVQNLKKNKLCSSSLTFLSSKHGCTLRWDKLSFPCWRRAGSSNWDTFIWWPVLYVYIKQTNTCKPSCVCLCRPSNQEYTFNVNAKPDANCENKCSESSALAAPSRKHRFKFRDGWSLINGRRSVSWRRTNRRGVGDDHLAENLPEAPAGLCSSSVTC